MPSVKCAYCNKEAASEKTYRCGKCERWICPDHIKSTWTDGPHCPKCDIKVEKG